MYITPSVDVWVIDQVWGQDGWMLAKFFFCVFMDRDEVGVHKLAKKNEAYIQPSWSIKDLLYGFWWNFACGIQRVVQSRQDGSIFMVEEPPRGNATANPIIYLFYFIIYLFIYLVISREIEWNARNGLK